jgi:hypothetical protein
MRIRTFISVCFLVGAACSSGGSSTPDNPDASTADAYESACGKPGDMGNELGIGTFCASLSDCSMTQSAPLCSSLGDRTTHFCTRTCQSTGPATQCGTGAECTCNANNQCGCTPSSCLAP